jgi:phospholipid-binding lipoprotein MlaA
MPLPPHHATPFRLMLAALVALPLWLSGCATPPPASDPDALADFRETNDPAEPTNRVFYAINNAIDKAVLKPVAQAYVYVFPVTVRTHTHNFLSNLGQPVELFSDMLETNPRRAGDSLMRFMLNTTVGVGGVFDVATGLGWPDHDADSGITLALWGIPNGPYLFLPILGPSSPREAVGFGGDYALNPLSWIGHGTTDAILGYSKTAVGAIDARAAVLDDLDKITSQALDPYATIRSLYRQHRQSQIENARHDNAATVPAWFPPVPAAAAGAPKP